MAPLRASLHIVLAEINLYEQCMVECEQQLQRWHADDAIVRKLDEVSGIGVLTASALKTAVGQPERFANGRRLSAWLGMTPARIQQRRAPQARDISAGRAIPTCAPC